MSVTVSATGPCPQHNGSDEQREGKIGVLPTLLTTLDSK